MRGVGLCIEENLQEILGRFHAAVPRELGFREPALRLAAPILLQDLGRVMRHGKEEQYPWRRAVVLVLSQPEGGVRGLLREFALLRQALWETVSARNHAVPGKERRQVDRLLDEAAADAAERWAHMARLLPAPRLRERRAEEVRSAKAPPALKTLARGPSPLPQARPPRVTPPPLPAVARTDS
jgi:hypothetical protein